MIPPRSRTIFRAEIMCCLKRPGDEFGWTLFTCANTPTVFPRGDSRLSQHRMQTSKQGHRCGWDPTGWKHCPMPLRGRGTPVALRLPRANLTSMENVSHKVNRGPKRQHNMIQCKQSYQHPPPPPVHAQVVARLSSETIEDLHKSGAG